MISYASFHDIDINLNSFYVILLYYIYIFFLKKYRVHHLSKLYAKFSYFKSNFLVLKFKIVIHIHINFGISSLSCIACVIEYLIFQKDKT